MFLLRTKCGCLSVSSVIFSGMSPGMLKFIGTLRSALLIERLNKVIDELVKEKDEEKERMNGVIEGLAAENKTMRNRIETIESMLKVMAQGGQSSCYG
ncbi:hypothetical protein QVD17_22774 [Tagetes erecta]|uniref:Uncharacterized protein n=1 Tax=Tagetes erecta TaxID=13708 RepID=A0AAD8NTT7_TARER|nr:hypothetical protein QVD17_22774 [Tagetes erecta]